MSVAGSTWKQNRRGREGGVSGMDGGLSSPLPASAAGGAPAPPPAAWPVPVAPVSVPARHRRLAPHGQRRLRRPAQKEVLL